jgi:DNA-binding FrmR family transcriptional regulator
LASFFSRTIISIIIYSLLALIQYQYIHSSLDEEECVECDAILEQLENIDDEADELGISFVKSEDPHEHLFTTFIHSLNSFSFLDDDECVECDAILEQLENIDDEADEFGINFVKNDDPHAARHDTLFYFKIQQALLKKN